MIRKILIVDDDEGIVDALKLILTEEGYSVATAYKGEEVYGTVLKYKPNLILLDVLMSGKDGRHICKQLKANPNSKTIPIIMVSAHPTAQKGALECGAEDYLAKPFDIDDLLVLVKKYIA